MTLTSWLPFSSRLAPLIRRGAPRRLRNAVRAPGRTVAWWLRHGAYLLGSQSSCAITPGWTARCHPASRPVFELYARLSEFQREMEEFVALCRPSMTLWDVGAHFGLFTLAAARFGGPQATVIAFEPSDVAADILAANVRLAGAHARVRIRREAVGADDGLARLLTTGAGGEHMVVPADTARTDALRIPQRTLDSLLMEGAAAPTHLKIDVEGSEDSVLRGARRLLAEHQPIVFLELHAEMLRRSGRKPDQVLELLSAVGYDDWREQSRPVGFGDLDGRSVLRLVCRAGSVR